MANCEYENLISILNENNILKQERDKNTKIIHKQVRWAKDFNITYVNIETEIEISSNEIIDEWIFITGYNPFPFMGELHTSKSIFEKWMLENGFKKIYKEYHETSVSY